MHCLPSCDYFTLRLIFCQGTDMWVIRFLESYPHISLVIVSSLALSARTHPHLPTIEPQVGPCTFLNYVQRSNIIPRLCAVFCWYQSIQQPFDHLMTLRPFGSASAALNVWLSHIGFPTLLGGLVSLPAHRTSFRVSPHSCPLSPL
jgi:hypothetical protein